MDRSVKLTMKFWYKLMFMAAIVTTSTVWMAMKQQHIDDNIKKNQLVLAGFQQKARVTQAIRNITKSTFTISSCVASSTTTRKPAISIPPMTSYDPERSMKLNADFTREQCSRIKGPSRNDLFDYFVRSPRSKTLTSFDNRSLLFTPIPKCGFTTWTYIFYSHAGKMADMGRDSMWAWDIPFPEIGFNARDLETIKPIQKNFKDKILFVREPYDRLVSAYLNKAVHADGLYSKTFHLPCKWLRLNHKKILTFSQFVQCILDKARSHSRALSSRTASIDLDIHWLPQTHLSLPCATNYTFIGKFDHFKEDVQFMIKYLNLNATIPVTNKSKMRADKNLSHWYRMLSKSQLEALEMLYGHDFNLFGFDKKAPM